MIVLLVATLLVTVFLIPSEVMSSSKKVQLSVFYETLCPACQADFREQIKPTSLALGDYMETHLVPFGNAHIIHDGNRVKFQCQHGPKECLYNMITACAIARIKSNLDQVLMASCIMENKLKICIHNFGLNWSDISSCVSGREGTELMLKYGNETLSLRPRLTGVPTIIIGGQILNTNLKTAVCAKLAQEGVKPKACQGAF